MRPELVSEERLRQISSKAADKALANLKANHPDWTQSHEIAVTLYAVALSAARAALEELGIVRVIKLGKEETYNLCDLDVRYGAVLVRAKEKPCNR